MGEGPNVAAIRVASGGEQTQDPRTQRCIHSGGLLSSSYKCLNSAPRWLGRGSWEMHPRMKPDSKEGPKAPGSQAKTKVETAVDMSALDRDRGAEDVRFRVLDPCRPQMNTSYPHRKSKVPPPC